MQVGTFALPRAVRPVASLDMSAQAAWLASLSPPSTDQEGVREDDQPTHARESRARVARCQGPCHDSPHRHLSCAPDASELRLTAATVLTRRRRKCERDVQCFGGRCEPGVGRRLLADILDGENGATGRNNRRQSNDYSANRYGSHNTHPLPGRRLTAILHLLEQGGYRFAFREQGLTRNCRCKSVPIVGWHPAARPGRWAVAYQRSGAAPRRTH